MYTCRCQLGAGSLSILWRLSLFGVPFCTLRVNKVGRRVMHVSAFIDNGESDTFDLVFIDAGKPNYPGISIMPAWIR